MVADLWCDRWLRVKRDGIRECRLANPPSSSWLKWQLISFAKKRVFRGYIWGMIPQCSRGPLVPESFA